VLRFVESLDERLFWLIKVVLAIECRRIRRPFSKSSLDIGEEILQFSTGK
jgi:hypothetical protein